MFYLDAKALGEGKLSGERTRADAEGREWGLVWRETATPFSLATGHGERCKLPGRIVRRGHDRPKVLHYFRHPGWPLLTLQGCQNIAYDMSFVCFCLGINARTGNKFPLQEIARWNTVWNIQPWHSICFYKVPRGGSTGAWEQRPPSESLAAAGLSRKSACAV